MQLNIKNEATVKLAHEVAKRFDETLVQSIHRGLEMRLKKAPQTPTPISSEERQRRILDAGRRFAELPVLDERSPEEMLYDDQGNPK